MNPLLRALAAALALSAAPPALAQDTPVELRISLWVPPAHPLVPATREWAASIEAASGGTIKAVVFPSEQLGRALDHYDMARDGVADVASVNPGFQPGRFPLIAAGQIPLTFSDGHKGTRALDAWYRAYAPAEMGDTKFCLAMIHAPGSLHGRRRIAVPADLRGLKVRPAQSTLGQLVSAAGGSNLQASAVETRDMLERGAADAIFFPWGSAFPFGLDKVATFHIEDPLYTTPFTYAMNRAKYDAMSAAQKKVVDDHCTSDWAQRISAPWTEYETAGLARMKATAGHEVYRLTPEQLGAWKASTEPLTRAWSEAVRKAGHDPDKALADLQEMIRMFGAGL